MAHVVVVCFKVLSWKTTKDISYLSIAGTVFEIGVSQERSRTDKHTDTTGSV